MFVFDYKAEMDNKIWGECEHDHVFTGNYKGQINPDPEEIDEYKWVKVEDLKKDIKRCPEKYTPWFRIILERIDV
jgi:isopentenyl-diphosphate delta-isomerase